MSVLFRTARAVLPTAALLLLTSGCAATSHLGRDSSARGADPRQARELQQRWRSLQDQRRVDMVAANLLEALPPRARSDSNPYSGLHVADAKGKTNLLLAQAVGLSHAARPFVYAVDPLGPGAVAGIVPGDEILSFQGAPVKSAKAFYKAVAKADSTKPATVTVLRAEDEQEFELPRTYRPKDLTHFVVTDRQFVNAFADRQAIVLTAGMLRFLKGADELAVVIGHEIGHIARGHLSGSYVGVGFTPSFSRDLEREADRYGLELAHQAGYNAAAGLDIWSRFTTKADGAFDRNRQATHPTSTERLAIARKVLERLPPRPQQPAATRATATDFCTMQRDCSAGPLKPSD